MFAVRPTVHNVLLCQHEAKMNEGETFSARFAPW